MTHGYFYTILLFTIFSTAVYGDSPYNQDKTECPETSTTTVNSDSSSNNNQFPHQIHTISFIGAGIGHVNSSAFKKVSVDFFISHLWEILSRCAVGIAGEYTTDINKASLASITGVIDLYPFKYGPTPYLGIETGIGYVQVPGTTDFGIAFSAESGILAVKISNLLFGFSARLTVMTIRIAGNRPSTILIKAGILL